MGRIKTLCRLEFVQLPADVVVLSTAMLGSDVDVVKDAHERERLVCSMTVMCLRRICAKPCRRMNCDVSMQHGYAISAILRQLTTESGFHDADVAIDLHAMQEGCKTSILHRIPVLSIHSFSRMLSQTFI